MTKILIVDDSDMMQFMLSGRLKRRGFEVVVAGDGEAGVAAALAESPDVILMDMTLPGISGCEATKQIKATEATREIPVIILTGNASDKDHAECRAAGCDDLDTKPVDFNRLLEKIKAVVPGES